MSRIHEIAHQYVDEIAALDPNLATGIGVPGHDREMTDFSPEGPEAIAALNRRTVGELRAGQVEDQAGEREVEADARVSQATGDGEAGRRARTTTVTVTASPPK